MVKAFPRVVTDTSTPPNVDDVQAVKKLSIMKKNVAFLAHLE